MTVHAEELSLVALRHGPLVGSAGPVSSPRAKSSPEVVEIQSREHVGRHVSGH